MKTSVLLGVIVTCVCVSAGALAQTAGNGYLGGGGDGNGYGNGYGNGHGNGNGYRGGGRGYRQGHGDHDTARDAVRRGDAVPLSRILADVERTVPGRFIEAKLDHEDGRLVYKVDVLDPKGRVIKLCYDARDGTLLKRKDGKP